jgi:hypothetical protein
LDDQLEIIWRNRIVQRGLVAPNLATLLAFVYHNPTLFARMLHANRLEHSAAIAGPVARKFIDVQA